MKKQLLAGLVIILGLSYLLGTSKTSETAKRETAVKSVVYITTKNGNTGGTGFHIKAPSSQKYIITNAHVCEIGKDTGIVYVRFEENDHPIPRKIIEESIYTDLCLVEAMPQGVPAELATQNPNPKEQLKAIGHPHLLPITVTDGTMIGYKDVKMLLNLGIAPGTCEDPKNEKSEVQVFIFMVPACLVKVRAIMTTIPILGGSSGSPVLNSEGKVAGVAFASESQSNWALVVPVSDLHTFIEKY